MSVEHCLQAIVAKLDQLSQGLENLEKKIGGGSVSSTPSSSVGPSEDSPSVTEFVGLVNEFITKVLSTSKAIDGSVSEAATLFSKLADEQLNLLRAASASAKPSDTEVQSFLKPTFDIITQLADKARDAKGGKFHANIASISEGAEAFKWVFYAPTPGPYITEIIGGSQFHSNKLLREFKGKDENQVSFVQNMNGFLKGLQAFVKSHHTTGITWNPKGGKLSDFKSSSAGSGSGPAPPPPGPPPKLDDAPVSTSSSSDGDSRNALLAALNKGEGITTGLKKVTSDMKTKNRTDRSGVVTAKAPVAKKTQAPKQPPKIALEGSKWVVEYVTSETTIDITETRQTLYLYKCDGAAIRINGKFNAITVDSCRKTIVVFDDAISTCELVNCNSMKLQVNKSIPSVSIDKTSGCQLYLSETALATQVITSKIDEVNVLIKGPEDWLETPVPEQFVSTWVDGKLKTESISHIGE